MTDLTRRRAMAIAGATGMAAVAGCSSSADEDDPNGEGNGNENGNEDGNEGAGDLETGDENGDEPSPSGTVLGDILIENVDVDAHTVDVLVEFGNEIEHWSSHDLDTGGDGATLERDWTTDPGQFRVTVRLDGDEFTQVTPARWNDTPCLNLFILVNRQGEMNVTSEPGSGPCST